MENFWRIVRPPLEAPRGGAAFWAKIFKDIQMKRITAIVSLLLMSLSAPSFSQSYGGGGGGGWGGGWSDDKFVLSDQTTRKVSELLTGGVRNCQARLEKPYRYDCYREVYRRAARDLSGRRPYTEVRDALIQVERRLNSTVTRNADPQAPRARLNFQSFRAIRPETLPQAKQEFIAALEEAETTLLRSAENGNNTHFVRIAEALNSNKLLLRSALLLTPFAILAVIV